MFNSKLHNFSGIHLQFYCLQQYKKFLQWSVMKACLLSLELLMCTVSVFEWILWLYPCHTGFRQCLPWISSFGLIFFFSPFESVFRPLPFSFSQLPLSIHGPLAECPAALVLTKYRSRAFKVMLAWEKGKASIEINVKINTGIARMLDLEPIALGDIFVIPNEILLIF